MSLAEVIAAMPLAVTPVTRGYTAEVTDKIFINQQGYTGYPGYPENMQSSDDYDTAEREAIQWEAELPPFDDPTGTAGVPGFDDLPDLTPAQHGVILAQLMKEYSR